MRTLFSDTLTLVMVMDPLGNIPVLLGILNKVPPARRIPIILRENLFAFLILLIFLFFGQYILSGLGISQAALRIAGGIILFLIALRMIFPAEEKTTREAQAQEPYIVPLAVPMIAGPSAMATVILFGTQNPSHLELLTVALALSSLISTAILLFATPLRILLGARGLTAIERLMGLLLTTIAIQMFLDGINQFFSR